MASDQNSAEIGRAGSFFLALQHAAQKIRCRREPLNDFHGYFRRRAGRVNADFFFGDIEGYLFRVSEGRKNVRAIGETAQVVERFSGGGNPARRKPRRLGCIGSFRQHYIARERRRLLRLGSAD